jgi:DNA mismatch endonuclease (patch repair protein)
MRPSLVPPDLAVRRRMQRTPQRNNPQELAIRSALHEAGLRFRVNYRPLPSSRIEVDVAFLRHRLALMIDGCFWHCCPQHGTQPQRNAVWWGDKLAANRSRDRRADAALAAGGWTVMRVWAHQSVADVVAGVLATLRANRVAVTSTESRLHARGSHRILDSPGEECGTVVRGRLLRYSRQATAQ